MSELFEWRMPSMGQKNEQNWTARRKVKHTALPRGEGNRCR